MISYRLKTSRHEDDEREPESNSEQMHNDANNLAQTYKVLRLDGHTLSVDGREVSVLKEGDQVSLRCFLESHDGGGLEAEVRLQGRRQLKTQRLVHGGDKP